MDGLESGAVESSENTEQSYAPREAVEGLYSELQALKQQTQERERRFSNAFSPEKHSQEAQNAAEAQWFDDLLSASLEAEKAGHGMPHTLQIGMQLKSALEALKKMENKLAQQEERTNRLSDPVFQQETSVYNQIDNYIESTVAEIYGEPNKMAVDMITAQVVAHIKEVKQKGGGEWRNFLLSKGRQDQAVNRAIQKTIPPRALEHMREKIESERPFTRRDAEKAFSEAKEVQDPKLRESLQTTARQRILSDMFSGRKG